MKQKPHTRLMLLAGSAESTDRECYAKTSRRPLGSGMGSPNSRRGNPKLHGCLGVGKRFLVGVSMRHAAGKFRHFGDERLIFVTPENYDFVFVH